MFSIDSIGAAHKPWVVLPFLAGPDLAPADTADPCMTDSMVKLEEMGIDEHRVCCSIEGSMQVVHQMPFHTREGCPALHAAQLTANCHYTV